MKKKSWFTLMITGVISLFFSVSAFAGNVFWEPLSYFNSSTWQKADGYPNGQMFNCTWRANNVNFTNDGKLKLSLTSPANNKFDCGEYRSTNNYGYGLYEVSMKPAKNTGIVSSFFTYTGPSHGTQWDEIDIEFLGKDTTKAQFNWYKNEVGGNEYLHNLGFDASQDFHTYGFEWRPDYIDFYVDGKKVYRGTRNIPVTPGKIMMNLWPGKGVDEWLGRYDGRTPLQAEYEYVKYYPNGVPQDNPTPTPTIAPSTPTNPNLPLKGDVNGDGHVNSSDYSLFKRYLLRVIDRFPVGDQSVADVNRDGRIDSTDLTMLKRYLIRAIPSL
nr:endo-1,3-1,4-beta-glucanase [synthetic construct]